MTANRPYWTPTTTREHATLRIDAARRSTSEALTSVRDREIRWSGGRATVLNEGPRIVRLRGEFEQDGAVTAIQKIAELRTGEEIHIDSVEGWTVYASMLPSAVEWMRTDFEFSKRKTGVEERLRGAELLKEYLSKRSDGAAQIDADEDTANKFRATIGGVETAWTAATLIDGDRDEAVLDQAPEARDEAQIFAIVDLRGIGGRNFYTDEWAARLLRRNDNAYAMRGTASVAMLQFCAKAPDHRWLTDENGRTHENVPLIAELTLYRNPNALKPLPAGTATECGFDEYGAADGECDSDWIPRLIPVRTPDGLYVLHPPDGGDGCATPAMDGKFDENTAELDTELAARYPGAALAVERDELATHESGRALKRDGILVTIPGERRVIDLLEDVLKTLERDPSFKDWPDDCRAALLAGMERAEAMRDRNLAAESIQGLVGRYPGVCGGAPVLKGTRLNVEFALGALGTWAEIKDLTKEWRLDERFENPAEAVTDSIRYMIKVLKKDERREAR